MITRLYYWILDYIYALKWHLRALTQHRLSSDIPASNPGKPVVILIPGVYEPWVFMQPLAITLRRAGHPVMYVEELGYNTGEIPVAAEAVRRLIDHRHLKNAIIVAHSKGGLVGKYFLSHLNHDQAVSRLIAISTPFSGSSYARIWLLRAIRSLSPGSPMIRDLLQDVATNSNIISMYGIFDPHIPGGSHLDGATNIRLPVQGHFRILGSDLAKRAILEWVDLSRHSADTSTKNDPFRGRF